MADHEDYLPGEAPAAHKVSHQDGGADEISVAGLSGELADDQPPKAHDLGGAKHNADTLANLNAKIIATTLDDSGDPRDPNAHAASHQNGGADEISVAGLAGEGVALAAHRILPAIHHIRFTAAEARAAISNIFGSDGKADSNIDLDSHGLINVADGVNNQDPITMLQGANAMAAHAALPTVHQDAPALIETHRLAAGAHHAKYTDTEARAALSPISISPSAFFPRSDAQDWNMSTGYIANRANFTLQHYQANVQFPNGVTITKFTLYGFRNDVLSSMVATLYRITRINTNTVMAQVTAAWTNNYNSVYDDSISDAVIDNDNYSYIVHVYLDPNDNVYDVFLTGVKLEFTG